MLWYKKIFFLIVTLGLGSSVWANTTAINDEFVFWPTESVGSFDTYETDLFRFDYEQGLQVREDKEITFLVGKNSGKVLFQIFEPRKNLRYLTTAYRCFSHLKLEKDLCVSTLENPQFIKNLVLFPKEKKQEAERISFVHANGFLDSYDPRGFFNRGEMVALATKLRYPGRSFSEFKQRCFLDVAIDHPYAGEICWAKEEEIVIGIGRNFYPEASINVWGILKILGKVFEKEWDDPDMTKVPDIFLSKMHREHIATPMLLRAWELGILKNTEHQSLWANRSVRQEEVLQIVSDFLRSEKNSGKGNDDIDWGFEKGASNIFYDSGLVYEWERKKKSKADQRLLSRPIFLEHQGNRYFQIWLGGDLELYQSAGFIWLDDVTIKSIKAWFDMERLEGELEIILGDGTVQIYRPDIKRHVFALMKDGAIRVDENIDFLTAEKRSPKLITIPDQPKIPVWDIHLSAKDFVHFFKNSTRNTRYPTHLTMTYPDGKVEEYSVLMKARGNANRGYIKPSLTLESFSKFKENENYYGDEFLKGKKEVKLRSFINEETMIHEKLFYRAAQKIGTPAPNFIEALVRINGIPFGVFQVTEPIKKLFFSDREIATTDYFYAQNINARFDTDLGYYDSDDTTLSAYKSKGDRTKLLSLITGIRDNDSELLSRIDVESVVNYAYLVWRSNAWDSLTHNYYVLWNSEIEKWQMIPWDADLAWEGIPQDLSFEAFDRFGKNTVGSHNKLIHYVFTHLDEATKKELWSLVQNDWNTNVHLVDWAEEYRTNLKEYFEYDNRLWNGRFLERKDADFDTDVAILKLQRELLGVK